MDPAYPNGSGRGREIGRIGRIGQIISMGTGLPIRRIFRRGREIGRIGRIKEVDPAYPNASGVSQWVRAGPRDRKDWEAGAHRYYLSYPSYPPYLRAPGR